MEHHVVVFDPTGEYWEGAVVGPGPAQLINQRGGVAIPADPAMFAVSGIGAFCKRAWGSGWAADHSTPRQYAPVAMYLMKEHRIVHWAAKLVPDARFADAAEGITSPAALTIAATPPRGNLLTAPITPRTQPVRLRDLGPAKDGGWIVRGNAFMNVAAEGAHGFSLYGGGGAFRVAWLAVGAIRV